MILDPKKYHHHLDGFDLTEAEKDDYIFTLCGALENIIDRMCGTHPVTEARVDNSAPSAALAPAGGVRMLECRDRNLRNIFEELVGGRTADQE